MIPQDEHQYESMCMLPGHMTKKRRVCCCCQLTPTHDNVALTEISLWMAVLPLCKLDLRLKIVIATRRADGCGTCEETKKSLLSPRRHQCSTTHPRNQLVSIINDEKCAPSAKTQT